MAKEWYVLIRYNRKSCPHRYEVWEAKQVWHCQMRTNDGDCVPVCEKDHCLLVDNDFKQINEVR